MFMKVAKAYEALTDPVAKENWERYGNPDGKTAMEVRHRSYHYYVKKLM